MGISITEFVGDSCEKTIVGMNNIFTRIEDEEVSSSVSVFCFAAGESCLTEGCSLLISQNPGHRHTVKWS